MTNDQRLDGFHNYRFEMYCADQAEITSLRTQLAEVARERDKLIGVLECANKTAKRRGEDRDRLQDSLESCHYLASKELGQPRGFESAVLVSICTIVENSRFPQPEPQPLTPADRVMIALAGRDKDDAERTLDKMYPKPEPKPEAPKCKFCGGRGPHPMSAFDTCPTCGTGRAQ